jgi:hypothetical protein
LKFRGIVAILQQERLMMVPNWREVHSDVDRYNFLFYREAKAGLNRGQR